MVTSLFKKEYCIYVLLTLILTINSYSNNTETKVNAIERKESEIKKELQHLELNIALVAAEKESPTRLAFIAKNNGKEDCVIPDFRIGANGIVKILPNGNSARFSSELMGGIKPITIKPTETKIWYMEPSQLLMSYQDEGLYRIKWRIYDIESKEFLLLKEKDKKENLETNIQK